MYRHKPSPAVGGIRQPIGSSRFREPPSAPPDLIPSAAGAIGHSFRYSSFVREEDLRGLSIRYDEACGNPLTSLSKTPLFPIFSELQCPVIGLGYLADHRQWWRSEGTALGEVVYSLSLAPGESRNIAVIDMRRRQRGGRSERTTASEELDSRVDHTFALEEVATAVALEHQNGKTATEANTLVSAGSFVAAGALVGGVAGGVIGTIVEPGGGTAIGAAVGAGAGVVAGGLVFAGSQAIGMIEAESSGSRDVMGRTNQRIAQSTSQQSALIRSLWSTVVTEDVQEERFRARTSNVTNYNHMHALNIEYYEVLHRYRTITELKGVIPVLYLPFAALPLMHDRTLIEEFWDSIRLGLDPSLREKGDKIFLEPPPEEFVPEPVPDVPPPPATVNIEQLEIRLELDWDFSLNPVDWMLADEMFRDVSIEIETTDEADNSHYLRATSILRRDDPFKGVSLYTGLFDRSFGAASITGIRISLHAPADLFDEGVHIRLLVESGRVTPASALSLENLLVYEGQLEYDEAGRARRRFAWAPLESAIEQHRRRMAEIDEIRQRNEAERAAHEALMAQRDQWKKQVTDAISREPYRFTMIILSAMEAGRLSWILERLHLVGDDPGEQISIPLHAVAHTVPIGISAGCVLLRMKEVPLKRLQSFLTAERADMESILDLGELLGWPGEVAARFADGLEELSAEETVFLPGAGVFAEAVLGRSNGAEYIDPDRYWNWQDSPIPHQAPTILPVSTSPRTTAPLPTDPRVPGAEIPLAGAPDFPAPSGLAGVLQAVQNGAMFRDMSKTDQLAGILGDLSRLAGSAADAASQMTGEAASGALGAATDIGKSVAQLAAQLISQAPAQAASPPANPTVSRAASRAVEQVQGENPEVRDATRDAWGIPGSVPPASEESGGESPDLPSWRPRIDSSVRQRPGGVSSMVPMPTRVAVETESEVREILDRAAADSGAMPDPGELLPLFDRWYREGVVPLLVYGRNNPEYLTSAIRQYLDWQADLQMLGLAEGAEEIEQTHGPAMPLVEAGLEQAILTAYGAMEAENELDYVTDVLNWVATAQQLGIDDRSPLFGPGVVEQNPIRVVLDGPLVPAEAPAEGEGYTLRLTGGLAIGANPPLAGKTVSVEVRVEGGSATPREGSIHPALAFEAEVTRTTSDVMRLSVRGRATLLQGSWEFETVREEEIT